MQRARMHKGYKVPPAESNPVRAAASSRRPVCVTIRSFFFPFLLSSFFFSSFIISRPPARTYVRKCSGERAAHGWRWGPATDTYAQFSDASRYRDARPRGCRVADTVNIAAGPAKGIQDQGSIWTEGRSRKIAISETTLETETYKSWHRIFSGSA